MIERIPHPFEVGPGATALDSQIKIMGGETIEELQKIVEDEDFPAISRIAAKHIVNAWQHRELFNVVDK